MIIRLTASFTDGRGPGHEYDAEDGEARRLISAGFAIPVIPDKIERAVKAPVTEKRKAK